jgi:hypothetical protein
MNYLDNKICKLTSLFPIDYSIKKNIISCSFFKLSTTPYKDFNRYINGLEELYNDVNTKYKDEKFTIRLFIDNTIYDDKKLFDRIQKMNKIELILYSCSDYLLEPEKKYHIGLFGTFVRFFPMFDFPNNDADIVIISDIDDTRQLDENFKKLNWLKKKENFDKIYIFKSGDISSSILFNVEIMNKNIINPYAIAPNFISLKKCNHLVIYNFLSDMKNSDKIFSLYIYKLKLKSNLYTDKKFLYGFDEYFLNVSLMNYLIDNKIPFATDITWYVNGSLYFFHRKKKYNNNETNLVNKYINLIINNSKLKISTSNDDNDKKYSIIDKMLWDKYDKTSIKIFYEFYKFYLNHLNDSEYEFLFDKNVFEIIKKFDLFGSYNFEILIFNLFDNENNNKNKKLNYEIIKNSKLDDYMVKNLNDILEIQLKKNIITPKINCNTSFVSNLMNYRQYIKEINMDNGVIVIKKDLYGDNNKDNTQENIFISKYKNLIDDTCFKNFISFPKKVIYCSNSTICEYEKFTCNYNDMITKITFKKWINYTIQICFTVYYLNNILGIYHNDLYERNDLKNIMVCKNNSEQAIDIHVDNFMYNVLEDEHIVLINFEQYSKKPSNSTMMFYDNNLKKNNIKCKYISETFIAYYYSFKKFFHYDDYFNIAYSDVYKYLETESNNLKEFDFHIISYLYSLYLDNI